MSEGLVQRKNARNRNQEASEERAGADPNAESAPETEDKYKQKRPKLTLMEEVLLLSLKDDNGNSFLLNDTVSLGIRACILIELALRGKIEMEALGVRRRSSEQRNLVVLNKSLTGDPILDEALRTISEAGESDSVAGWISLLSGETWNPFHLQYQMRNVRSRLCKGLVEKGVCSATNQNFVLFNMTVYPIVDGGCKRSVINYFNDLLTTNWKNVELLNTRDLALLAIVFASEIYDQPLSLLNDSNYELAFSRLRQIGNLDPEEEIQRIAKIGDIDQKQDNNVKQVIFACLNSLYNL